MPAVDADLFERAAGVGDDGLDDVARLERGRLERRARDVPLVHEAREPDERAARIRAPVRGEQPGEGRDEVRAAVVVDRRGEGLDVFGALDDAEVVAQPLHERAGDGDRPLERVAGGLVAAPVGDGGDEAVAGAHDVGARCSTRRKLPVP